MNDNAEDAPIRTLRLEASSKTPGLLLQSGDTSSDRPLAHCSHNMMMDIRSSACGLTLDQDHEVEGSFDTSTEAVSYVDKDFSEGGILMLSNSEKSLIKESMKSAECKRYL